MAVKRKPRRPDPQRSLRDHLVELLDGGHAHVTFEDAIADWPPEIRSAKPAGQPFTPWRVLEHIRISQWDIVEFTKSARSEEHTSELQSHSDLVCRLLLEKT